MKRLPITVSLLCLLFSPGHVCGWELSLKGENIFRYRYWTRTGSNDIFGHVDSAVNLITGTIAEERDAGVRNAMLRYLVKNRGAYPGIKETLRNLAGTERDAANRRLIYRGLYSKQDQDGD